MSFCFKQKLEGFEDSLANLSSIASECTELTENNTYNTVFKGAYFQNECKDIKELIEELSEKMLSIKTMLMADKFSPDDENYERLVNEKIIENNKQKQFMEMLLPYMILHMNN
jgi:hypothetical protein